MHPAGQDDLMARQRAVQMAAAVNSRTPPIEA
jgi:hypothetical protein